jgi:hypothetical protein
MNVFNVTERCAICGGSPHATYNRGDDARGPYMRRRCDDCGYSWDVRPVTRSI